MRRLQVVVIGDAQADKEKFDFCEQLGRYLAKNEYTVITGGRSGVMEAVSKGAYHAGGITVGILPGEDFHEANPWCNVVIPTGMGHTRNSFTALSADIVISIGGKAGTLTELGFAWIYNKPIIAVKQFGGWSENLSDKKIDDRRTGNIIAVDSFDALKIQLQKVAAEIDRT